MDITTQACVVDLKCTIASWCDLNQVIWSKAACLFLVLGPVGFEQSPAGMLPLRSYVPHSAPEGGHL